MSLHNALPTPEGLKQSLEKQLTPQERDEAMINDLKERLRLFMKEKKAFVGYELTQGDLVFLYNLQGENELTEEEKEAAKELFNILEKRNIGME